MLHRKNASARARRLLACAALFALAGRLLAPAAPAAARPLPKRIEPTAAFARIDDIYLGEVKAYQAPPDKAKVTRVLDGKVEAAQTGMTLYAGDIVETGEKTQLTLVFASTDKPQEQSTEAIVYAGTKVTVGSLWISFGKVLHRVRGYFNSGGGSGTGGTGSTEYTIAVAEDGQMDVTVFEGTVNVTAYDIVIDGDPTLKYITLKNETPKTCRKPHEYRFGVPENMPWLSLLPARATLPPGRSVRVLPKVVTLPDKEKSPAPGSYRGEVSITCLDCTTEPGCDFNPETGGSRVPVEVTIRPASSGKEEPVGRKQTLSLGQGATAVPESRELSDAELKPQIEETNERIIRASAKGVGREVPRKFNDKASRAQSFRDARLRAFLNDDADGYKEMGDVYLDWGEGARAVDAYEIVDQSAVAPIKEAPAFRTNYGEALRLVGDLDPAEIQVRKALESEGPNKSARSLIALGNIKLDRAREAGTLKDKEQEANRFLKEAEDAYTQAEALLSQQPDTVSPRAVLQSNFGDLYSLRRNFAYNNIAPPECASRLAKCISDFNEKALSYYSRAVGLAPDYIHAVNSQGLARVEEAKIYKQTGAFKSRDFERAISQARSQFEKARSLDPAYQPAYAGMGLVYVNLNNPSKAREEFAKAAQLGVEANTFLVAVPDVKGKSEQAAVKIITSAGLVPVKSGEGEVVTSQQPAPGETKTVPRGSKVTLRFGKNPAVRFLKSDSPLLRK